MLFISTVHNKAAPGARLSCRYDYEFASEQLKQQYVLSALQNGTLFCYRFLLSRTGRPDMDFIAAELNYISTYAIHKAKQLEEELWSVAGVIDVIDISAELPWRFGTSIELLQQQQKMQQQLLAKLKQPVT